MTIQLHTLSNGFQIVTEHMPGLKSASIGVWVDVGGRHERIEQNGIAHFLEHMAFKGTKTRSALQIAEAIEDVGGFLNAYDKIDVGDLQEIVRKMGASRVYERMARGQAEGTAPPLEAPLS